MIYTTHLIHGALVLLVIYSKSAIENIPVQVLRQIAKELGYATS